MDIEDGYGRWISNCHEWAVSNCNLTEGTVTRVDNWQVVIYAISFKTLPKEPRIQGWSSAYQSNLFRSYHKFKNRPWSNFIFRTSTKHQLQNLDQRSASRLNLKTKYWPDLASTKIRLNNLNKTSAAKYWPNSSYIINKAWPQILISWHQFKTWPHNLISWHQFKTWPQKLIKWHQFKSWPQKLTRWHQKLISWHQFNVCLSTAWFSLI